MDMKQRNKPSLYKTELCHNFVKHGVCPFGNKCQFAHGGDDLRRPVRHPKYKTVHCKTFWTFGSCPYGTRCQFLHLEPPKPNAASDSNSSNGSNDYAAFPLSTDNSERRLDGMGGLDPSDPERKALSLLAMEAALDGMPDDGDYSHITADYAPNNRMRYQASHSIEPDDGGAWGLYGPGGLAYTEPLFGGLPPHPASRYSNTDPFSPTSEAHIVKGVIDMLDEPVKATNLGSAMEKEAALTVPLAAAYNSSSNTLTSAEEIRMTHELVADASFRTVESALSSMSLMDNGKLDGAARPSLFTPFSQLIPNIFPTNTYEFPQQQPVHRVPVDPRRTATLKHVSNGMGDLLGAPYEDRAGATVTGTALPPGLRSQSWHEGATVSSEAQYQRRPSIVIESTTTTSTVPSPDLGSPSAGQSASPRYSKVAGAQSVGRVAVLPPSKGSSTPIQGARAPVRSGQPLLTRAFSATS